MAFSTSLQGIRAATARFDASAARVASNSPAVDTTSELVDQMVARQSFEANAKVLSAARDMLDYTLERWG